MNRHRREALYIKDKGFRLPAYRFYRLDGVGKIITADWIAADDDDQAIEHARQRADGKFELWDRNRLVARHPRANGE